MQENPRYRYHKLWLSIGYILVTLVIYLSVTSSPPLAEIQYADKAGHFFAYFAMMAWFAQLYHTKKQRIIYALLFIAMGMAMEFVQSFDSARMAEVADMVANTLGVLIALLITRISAFRLILKKIETYI